MCPLRLILLFLSASLAGFFVLKNLKAKPFDNLVPIPCESKDASQEESSFRKIKAAMGSGFWTFVDMASGRYLWRTLVSSSSNHSH